MLLSLAQSIALCQSPEPLSRPKAVDNPVSPNKAEIAGYIRLVQDNRGVSSVLVRLETDTGTLVAQTWTSHSGRFEFPGIGCGYYVIAVDVPGYKPIRIPVEHSFESFDQVLYLVPGVNEYLSEGASSRPPHIPLSARREYEKAQQALAKKNLASGIEHLRQTLRLAPDFEEASFQLSLAYLQQGALEQSREILEKALRLNPSSARFSTLLGIVLARQQRTDLAVKAFKQAIARDDRAWRAHFELGRILMFEGNFDEAYDHARQAHRLNPRSAMVHLLLYNLSLLRRDFQAALTEAEELLDQFPDTPWTPQIRERRERLRKVLGLS
ncbi:MAG TPA: tetratricopeptide repeat protein [Blastocatellia bacterium]|nr:tetratricopeptide repeat protein [Blastocatellia bacterium]